MSRTVPNELPVTLDRTAAVSLPQQLAGELRARVRAGELAAGARLPSTRDLARDLRVSRAVVQAAYDQLHAEGWIVGRVGAGTYVADVGGGHPDVRSTGAHRRPAVSQPRTGSRISLRPGTPWTDRKPHSLWRRAWREVSAAAPPPGYADPLGVPDLREALCDYLVRARGVACHPDEVLVTTGTTHGLQLLLHTALAGAGAIGLEDPGYTSAAAMVRSAGKRLHDCPVDRDGLVVEALPDTPRLGAMYVTPSHQFPLGGRLPVARRYELVDWAKQHGALVVEDDYDSEFRYDVAPLPALAQLDRDTVVYLGTASKTLGPALRIGWLAGSADLVARIAEYREDINDRPSWPAQRALLAMFRDGHVDQTVRRARRIYADRCARVADALEPYGEIVGKDAGLHVNLLLPPEVDETKVCELAATRGVEVDALGAYRRSAPGPMGLTVGYGACSDAELDRGLAVLVEVLEEGH